VAFYTTFGWDYYYHLLCICHTFYFFSPTGIKKLGLVITTTTIVHLAGGWLGVFLYVYLFGGVVLKEATFERGDFFFFLVLVYVYE
jgi:hypothetical protein